MSAKNIVNENELNQIKKGALPIHTCTDLAFDRAKNLQPDDSDPLYLVKMVEMHKEIYKICHQLNLAVNNTKTAANSITHIPVMRKAMKSLYEYGTVERKLLQALNEVYHNPDKHTIDGVRDKLQKIIDTAPDGYKKCSGYLPDNVAERYTCMTYTLYKWNKYRRVYSFGTDFIKCLADSIDDDMELDFLESLPYHTFCIMPGDTEIRVLVHMENKKLYCTIYGKDSMLMFILDVSKDIKTALSFKEYYVSMSILNPFTLAAPGYPVVLGTISMDESVRSMMYGTRARDNIEPSGNAIRDLVFPSYTPLAPANLKTSMKDDDNTTLHVVREMLGAICYLASNNRKVAEYTYVKGERHRRSDDNDGNIIPKNVDLYEGEIGVIHRTYNPSSSSGVIHVSDASPSNGKYKKSPHVRRGHWHRYWVGKRNSAEQKCIVKFLAPTLVGDFEGTPVCIDEVKTPSVQTSNINVSK